MKTLTAVVVMFLAVGSTRMCSADTVRDKTEKDWTCRVVDGTIYTRLGNTFHVFNIKAARDANETGSTNHNPICISPDSERVIWSWPGAQNITVAFTPITMDHGVCQNSSQPFRSPPGASGTSDFLPSDIADDTYSYCAYELTFTSSLGKFDPHIIIRGQSFSVLLEELKEELKHLEAEEQRVKKDLEELEKAQGKVTKQP